MGSLSKSLLVAAFVGASQVYGDNSVPVVPANKGSLPVLYRADQPTSNVVVYRGAEVALARQKGLIPNYNPGGRYNQGRRYNQGNGNNGYNQGSGYTTTVAPLYKPTPAPTYKPATTYAPKPTPTYKPAPTYAPKPTP